MPSRQYFVEAANDTRCVLSLVWREELAESGRTLQAAENSLWRAVRGIQDVLAPAKWSVIADKHLIASFQQAAQLSVTLRIDLKHPPKLAQSIPDLKCGASASTVPDSGGVRLVFDDSEPKTGMDCAQPEVSESGELGQNVCQLLDSFQRVRALYSPVLREKGFELYGGIPQYPPTRTI